jgi:hypothetical protein
MHDGFRFYRGAPPTRRFLALARSGEGWTPAWPRWVVRLAARCGVVIAVPDYFDLLATGFCRLRPAMAPHEGLRSSLGCRPQRRRGFIHEYRELLAFLAKMRRVVGVRPNRS